MSKDEIAELISEQFLCRIAFRGDEYPYVAPFHYVLVDETIYFHFTDYGRKMERLEKDRHVCVEIEKYQPDLKEFRVVVLMGDLEIVKDPLEREGVVRRMAEQGKQMLSENFLAAHGLRREDGWSSLSPEKPLIIVKLKVAQESGLKSP
jgi:nitroimidazol reductase NimA-like FMN-containing flavoprotein (pyridoxamine 5'-phosphate oxidase superfamily)